MTEPVRDSVIPVQCRAPACASPRSCAPRCTMPASSGPTFWWAAPSAATTYARSRTCTWERLRDCRTAIAEHKPLPALPPRPGQPPRTCAQQFFRGIPEAEWSPELNAKLLNLAQTKVAMYDAYISEMEQTPQDEAYLRQHHRSM